jgi:succinate dehydrogenase / fumarate reductase cytochrome b subunit
MKEVFSQPLIVLLYVVGCFSLGWHLLHGFQSAFQTMGWKHRRYAGTIENIGVVFSIVVPLIFALMPVFMYFGWQLPLGNLTLLF